MVRKWDKPGIPHKGWRCTDVVDPRPDDERIDADEYGAREMCDQNPIRCVHVMEHDDDAGPLKVGSVCDERMSGDALVEQQDTETKYVATTELTDHDSRACYVCGCRISAERKTDYECPECGNRICSSCLELTDALDGVCLSCNRRADKLKAMWDTIAFVGIVIVVVILLCLVAACFLFPEARQTGFGD